VRDLSEALTGEYRHLSSCVLDGLRRHRLEAHRLSVRERAYKGMAEDEEPESSGGDDRSTADG
jgi:hypothetical protein